MNNDFTAMALHKTREQQLIARAENERQAKNLREQVSQRVRRIIRINNDPIR